MKPIQGTIWLITALILPSLPIIKRAGGLPLMLAYLLLGTGFIISLTWLNQNPKILPILNQRRTARFLTLALALTLIGAYTIVFPRVNSQTTGEGSDRDDALNLAVTRLLDGDYPYSEPTYLGNPISPLPGSILLATPFVILGNSALQNLFWVGVWLFFIWRLLQENPRLNSLIILALFSSAQLFYEVVTGSDLLSNAIFVAVLGLLWVKLSVSKTAGLGVQLLSACAFGLALASRINFALALPPLAVWVYAQTDAKVTVRQTALVGLVFLGVILGFYAASPADFTPVQTASEIGVLDAIIPHVGTVIIPVIMLIAVAVSCLPAVSERSMTSTKWAEMLGRLATVQAIPVLVGVLLISGFTRDVRVGFLFFGVTFMVFGVLAAIAYLNEAEMRLE